MHPHRASGFLGFRPSLYLKYIISEQEKKFPTEKEALAHEKDSVYIIKIASSVAPSENK